MRAVALWTTLVFIAGLAFLTLDVIAKDGIDVLVVLSLLVLALFAFGIVGALLESPGDRGGGRDGDDHD